MISRDAIQAAKVIEYEPLPKGRVKRWLAIRVPILLFVLGVAILGAALIYSVIAPQDISTRVLVTKLCLLITSAIMAFVAYLQSLIKLRERGFIIPSINWLVSVVRFQEEMRRTSGSDDHQVAEERLSQWPWGTHTTEALEHMKAAALRFWTLYDPADPGTAPTNEMVADWLKQEHGMSNDKAQAIASILRPQSIKPGKRR